MVLFDLGWYNRASVDRVLGFCTEEEQVRKFLEMTPLVETGHRRFRCEPAEVLLEVGPEELTRRLKGRIDDGRKI
jgi:polyphosphate kinase 2 (PPK2 family)